MNSGIVRETTTTVIITNYYCTTTLDNWRMFSSDRSTWSAPKTRSASAANQAAVLLEPRLPNMCWYAVNKLLTHSLTCRRDHVKLCAICLMRYQSWSVVRFVNNSINVGCSCNGWTLRWDDIGCIGSRRSWCAGKLSWTGIPWTENVPCNGGWLPPDSAVGGFVFSDYVKESCSLSTTCCHSNHKSWETNAFVSKLLWAVWISPTSESSRYHAAEWLPQLGPAWPLLCPTPRHLSLSSGMPNWLIGDSRPSVPSRRLWSRMATRVERCSWMPCSQLSVAHNGAGEVFA